MKRFRPLSIYLDFRYSELDMYLMRPRFARLRTSVIADLFARLADFLVELLKTVFIYGYMPAFFVFVVEIVRFYVKVRRHREPC